VSHSKLKAKSVIMVKKPYKKGARLVYEKNTIAYLDKYHGIYVFRNYHATSNVMFANPSKTDFRTWHRRLTYQNHRYVKETAKVVEGMEITKGKDNKPHACEACVSGKQRGRESAQARGKNNDYLTPDENEDLGPLINPGNIRKIKQKVASPPPALRTSSKARKPPVRLKDELNEGMTAERAKRADKAKKPP
jgi:hypothetical protein